MSILAYIDCFPSSLTRSCYCVAMGKEVKLHGASLGESMGDRVGTSAACFHILTLETTVGRNPRLMPCAECNRWELQGTSSHSFWPCNFNRLFLYTKIFPASYFEQITDFREIAKTEHRALLDLPFTPRVAPGWLVHY